MNEITVIEGLEITHENGIQCLVFAIRFCVLVLLFMFKLFYIKLYV